MMDGATPTTPAPLAALNIEKRPLVAHPAVQILLPIAFAIAVLGLWEILPAPTDIYARIVSAWPFLLQHAVPTGVEAAIGFLLATVLGVSLAVLLSYSKWAHAALYPNVIFFQLIPKIALAPLFIVWLGIGSSSRLAFSMFIAFFPVVIATLTGLNSTPPDMLRLCKALTARSWQVFLSVRFPYALPHIFSGLKIAVTFAIIGVIVGEFITAQAGLGYLILFASSQAETALILASIGMLRGGAGALRGCRGAGKGHPEEIRAVTRSA